MAHNQKIKRYETIANNVCEILSDGHLAPHAALVPLHAHLLAICHRGVAEIWRH